MLGVVGCQSISNDVLRAEMGMEKLSSRWTKLRLGYWRRLNVASGERTLVAISALRRKHLEWGYKGACDGWMGTTRDLLVAHGMYAYWLTPNLCSSQAKELWKDLVYEAVENAEDEALRSRFAAMSGEAVARYARIKNWDKVEATFAAQSGEVGRRGAQVIEPYLDGRAEPVGTRLKLMCRLGCLPTMDRVAREEKLPPGHGACRLCGEGAAESVEHLLLDCPTHDRHRTIMMATVNAALSLTDVSALNVLPTSTQVDILLGQSTGFARADDSISAIVTRFLKKAWRGRKWLTASLNATLGRTDTTWALKSHGDGRCAAMAPAPQFKRGRAGPGRMGG